MARKKLNISDILESNGIRALDKRIMIYEYLIRKKNHPTVEKIYKDLLHKSPSLSKTTVYNTLNLLLEKRLVQAINIENNELRYDADVSTHGHFKCTNCGEIYDFEMDSSNIPPLPLNGFTSQHVHYYVEGICENCNKTAQN